MLNREELNNLLSFCNRETDDDFYYDNPGQACETIKYLKEKMLLVIEHCNQYYSEEISENDGGVHLVTGKTPTYN